MMSIIRNASAPSISSLLYPRIIPRNSLIVNRSYTTPTTSLFSPLSVSLVLYGSPNAGKSSLLRSLLKTSPSPTSKSSAGVSAVSPKPHTTRGTINKKVEYDWGFIDVYDTPGLVSVNNKSGSNGGSRSTSKRKTSQVHSPGMTPSLTPGLGPIDVHCHVIDSNRVVKGGKIMTWIKEDVGRVRENVADAGGGEVVYVLNKVDLVRDKLQLLTLADELGKLDGRGKDMNVFYIDGRRGEGVEDIVDFCRGVGRRIEEEVGGGG